ncbi:hypothetical protein L1887_61881 [Cichorium endivia]|nr:hypothetical protein L1887_61881 [Cichorium endivia]
MLSVDQRWTVRRVGRRTEIACALKVVQSHFSARAHLETRQRVHHTVQRRQLFERSATHAELDCAPAKVAGALSLAIRFRLNYRRGFEIAASVPRQSFEFKHLGLAGWGRAKSGIVRIALSWLPHCRNVTLMENAVLGRMRILPRLWLQRRAVLDGIRSELELEAEKLEAAPGQRMHPPFHPFALGDDSVGDFGIHLWKAEFFTARRDGIGKVFEQHRHVRRRHRRFYAIAHDIVEVDAERIVTASSEPGEIAKLHDFEQHRWVRDAVRDCVARRKQCLDALALHLDNYAYTLRQSCQRLLALGKGRVRGGVRQMWGNPVAPRRLAPSISSVDPTGTSRPAVVLLTPDDGAEATFKPFDPFCHPERRSMMLRTMLTCSYTPHCMLFTGRHCISTRHDPNILILTGEAVIAELLSIDDDLLGREQNESDPGPLVGVVSPQMVGAPLDTRIALSQSPLLARIQLELHLAKDDDPVIQRLGAVHWAAASGRDVDKPHHRAVVVVRPARENRLFGSIPRLRVVNRPRIRTPHDLQSPQPSASCKTIMGW